MTHHEHDADNAEDRSDEREPGSGNPLERGVDRARSGFDRGVVDILAWLLDTETRARVYIYLRQHPWSTHEAVAEGTGIYPSTVATVLEELVEEGTVEERERAAEETVEYRSVPPSDLVGGSLDQIRTELGTVTDRSKRTDSGGDAEPVRIDIESGTSAEAEVGDADATVETDWEAEAERDDEGARVEGEVGGGVDVGAEDDEAGVEGRVDAEVGTEGVDVDVEADVETPDDDEDEDANS